MNRRRVVSVAVVTSVLCVLLMVNVASAELGGQVFFRAGFASLVGGDRGGEVFTDTNGAAGRTNDKKTGFSVGAGFDLPLFQDPWWGNTVLAEILIDYAQFSREKVVQTTGALLGQTNITRVTVNEVSMGAAPKYRIELGQWRPWIIPIGLEWQVISPPSNNTSYLDVGATFGAGIDYRIIKEISVGLDLRYHWSSKTTNAGAVSFITSGLYLGFNF